MRESVKSWLFTIAVAALMIVCAWEIAHAEPHAVEPPATACMTSDKLQHLAADAGATVWPIDGLRAVRFLSIVNHIDPPTDYRAESLLAVFAPNSDHMTLYFVSDGCARAEHVTLPTRTGVEAMRETFVGEDRRKDGYVLIHDIYSGLYSPKGQLCCNGSSDGQTGDCAPTLARQRADGVDYFVRGETWVHVPNSHVTFLPVPGEETQSLAPAPENLIWAHFCGCHLRHGAGFLFRRAALRRAS